jgi:hypothetical protein
MRNKYAERILFLGMSHQASVMTIAILTGYLARNIFRIAALYSAGLELLSNSKSKDWSSATKQFFSLAELRLGTGKDGDKNRTSRTI